MRIIKKLSGHSGCSVYLCENNNKNFIRKVSGNVSYNSRLKLQCNKQKEYKSNVFYTPKVLNEGNENNLFFYDMEYIQGIVLSQALCTLKVEEIFSVFNKLLSELINCELTYSENTISVMKNKINGLYRKLDAMKYNKYFSYLLDYDWTFLPVSSCHGNLTLENIIYDHNRLVLIDFLDSFIESPYIDLAKLLQDLECHWAYRNNRDFKDYEFRLNLAKEIVLERLSDSNDGRNKIHLIYSLLLLNLLRILPYSVDDRTTLFIERKAEAVYKKLKMEEIK